MSTAGATGTGGWNIELGSALNYPENPLTKPRTLKLSSDPFAEAKELIVSLIEQRRDAVAQAIREPGPKNLERLHDVNRWLAAARVAAQDEAKIAQFQAALPVEFNPDDPFGMDG